MSVELATQSDKKRVLEMAAKFYSQTIYKDHIPFDLETCANLFDTALELELCFVIRSDGEAQGFILGAIAPSFINRNYPMGS